MWNWFSYDFITHKFGLRFLTTTHHLKIAAVNNLNYYYNTSSRTKNFVLYLAELAKVSTIVMHYCWLSVSLSIFGGVMAWFHSLLLDRNISFWFFSSFKTSIQSGLSNGSWLQHFLTNEVKPSGVFGGSVGRSFWEETWVMIWKSNLRFWYSLYGRWYSLLITLTINSHSTMPILNKDQKKIKLHILPVHITLCTVNHTSKENF